MAYAKWALAVGFFISAVVIAAQQSEIGNHPLVSTEKGGMNETGPYEVIPDHFKSPLPDGWVWGPVVGIHAESPDRIYVYSRGMVPALQTYTTRSGLPARDNTYMLGAGSNMGRREHILTVYDRSGKIIEDWKELDALHQQGSSPHRLRVNPWDPDKHIWLVDVGRNTIREVTRDGHIVKTIGPAKGFDVNAGEAGGYQDLVFLQNGDFFALEGSRVVRFSKDGVQVGAFGTKGPAPGQIAGGHGIAIDRRGRIYVGESVNHRIQVFDETGKSLDIWPNIRFSGGVLALDKNDHIWVADAAIHRIAEFDLNGKLMYSWGVTGVEPGQLYGVSQFDVDSEGNLYTVEHNGGRIQMFRPKKGADPNHLIAQLIQ